MKTKNTLCIIIIILTGTKQTTIAQSNTFPLTGNVGIGTLSPTTSLQVVGASRFGSTTNYTQVDASGNLTFSGSSSYKVGNNKYAFQFAAIPNYGLFFNSSDRHYEFRNSLAAPVFYIHADSGQGIFSGGVTVGSSSLPPSNGLYVSGKVGIGTRTPDAKLHVTGGSEVTLGDGGTIVAGPIASKNLAIDRDEIQARDNGAANTLHLNQHGGNVNLVNGSLVVKDSAGLVGIGTTSPEARLQVLGGTDVTVSGGGTIVAGLLSNNNLGIDNNEIQARNNGVADTLFLNAGGGLVKTGADLTVAGGIINIGNTTYISGGNYRVITGGSVVPSIDDGWELGTSSSRWIDVWARDGSINTSDERDKTNIRDLNYGLKEIMKLRSVRFNWKNKINNDDKLGLIAQDLQKVLPEVVRAYEYKKDAQTGKTEKVASQRLGVMYADIIPVLIKAIQEQQKEIEELRNTINQSQSTSVEKDNATTMTVSEASIEQNVPNPLNSTTSIRYNIPSNAKNAQLVVSDVSGKAIKQIQLNKTGTGIIKIDASALHAGTYHYTLLIDGKIIETKRMLVAR
jgi:hypothetical protein